MSIRNATSTALSYGQHSLDRVVPPSTRRDAYASITTFARERPLLFSFLLTQAAISFLPFALLLSFAASLLFFTALSAFLFVSFWLAAALLLFVPALFVTATFALLVWAWAAACFVALRWGYELVFAAEAGAGPEEKGAAAPVARKDEEQEENKGQQGQHNGVKSLGPGKGIEQGKNNGTDKTVGGAGARGDGPFAAYGGWQVKAQD